MGYVRACFSGESARIFLSGERVIEGGGDTSHRPLSPTRVVWVVLWGHSMHSTHETHEKHEVAALSSLFPVTTIVMQMLISPPQISPVM